MIIRMIDVLIVITFVALILAVGGGITIQLGPLIIHVINPDRPLYWLLILLLIRIRWFRARSFLIDNKQEIENTLIDSRLLFVMLISLVAAFVLRNLGGGSLKDWDEAIYGSIARTMVEQGQWLSPVFNGTHFFDKPPLQFIFMALIYTLFGISEFTLDLSQPCMAYFA
ncbi:hypothetical protein JXQ70_02580 [bacterium]|nr:hypothetical protein [bacterium]